MFDISSIRLGEGLSAFPEALLPIFLTGGIVLTSGIA
jgi:hypothetical protein